MRGLLYVMSALAVVALGFWAYQENYATQQSLRDVRRLYSQIGGAHARIKMLNAEWAYLNRPDRLRDLADLNYDRLELLPLMPDAFGRVSDIPEPPPPLLPLTGSIAVSAPLNPDEEPL
ncbi:cell division protein FtsL [Pseudoroseicyclus aestuarii]|uniref:Cell division protein FtsL n=1 Tax=Pseudoroseicyclus aestuarii TaxID=1795041 RepID=A0A318STA3_9RHOB|nr:cell division protein FtsL [Pseudoroseicyclus aestuarii]PYE82532.1 hypothetical protein DFP88_104289 [Pseudoroseicyclus aestuarii]